MINMINMEKSHEKIYFFIQENVCWFEITLHTRSQGLIKVYILFPVFPHITIVFEVQNWAMFGMKNKVITWPNFFFPDVLWHGHGFKLIFYRDTQLTIICFCFPPASQPVHKQKVWETDRGSQFRHAQISRTPTIQRHTGKFWAVYSKIIAASNPGLLSGHPVKKVRLSKNF